MIIKRGRDFCALLTGGFLLLSLGIGVYPQECIEGITTTRQKVSGRVNGIQETFLSLVYRQEENALYAMAFLVDENTELKNKTDISQIERGDFVRVEYEQVTECAAGKEKLNTRVAKKIEFLKDTPDFQSVKSVKPEK